METRATRDEKLELDFRTQVEKERTINGAVMSPICLVRDVSP